MCTGYLAILLSEGQKEQLLEKRLPMEQELVVHTDLDELLDVMLKIPGRHLIDVFEVSCPKLRPPLESVSTEDISFVKYLGKVSDLRGGTC